MKKIPLTKGLFAIVDDSDYEELSAFKWEVIRNKSQFYAIRSFFCHSTGKSKIIRMHRAILGAACVGLDVDHVDGDGLNNQRKNLRACTSSENQRNKGINANNTSGYKGVHWSKGSRKWRAEIYVDCQKINLGLYQSPEAAHAAYCEAAIRWHGEFARAA